MIDDSEYPRVFFLMHKWIMESEYLSHMLYDLYKHYNDDYKKSVNTHEQRQYKEYKLRVCHAYRYFVFLSLMICAIICRERERTAR